MKPQVGQIWHLKNVNVYYCLTEKVRESNTEIVWKATPFGFGHNVFVNLYDKSRWDFIC